MITECARQFIAGPGNVSLEVAYSEESIDPQAWIDPEAVSLLNISIRNLSLLSA